MTITGFRIVTKSDQVQVQVNNRWYNLYGFKDGKFAIKKKVPKAFNPFFEFDEIETKKIQDYYNK